MKRHAQLNTLHSHLGELAAVLAHDPPCQWRKHFVVCQEWAASLLSHGFTQGDLNELSGSVKSVYGGAGSFTDYAPVRIKADGTFSLIAGMENFSELSGAVYESALELRVVGYVA
jgi:hypothetical protein